MAKKIQLTRGLEAIVDDEDFEWLNQWKWYALNGRSNRFYAARAIRINGRIKSILMHRELVAGISTLLEVDHINGNPLDNRKQNLRACTHAENTLNQGGRGGTSKYKGVHWHSGKGKWAAKIKYDGKEVHLGLYDSEYEAAAVYDKYCKALHGEFAKTNNLNGVEIKRDGRVLRSDNTSGYRGVKWHKGLKKWRAVVRFNKKQYSLGCYDDPKVAAMVYDVHLIEITGNKSAATNFPDELENSVAMVKAIEMANGLKTIGIHWSKEKEKWQAYIGHNSNQYHLGFFERKEDAMMVRDAKAFDLFGAGAKLNMPDRIADSIAFAKKNCSDFRIR